MTMKRFLFVPLACACGFTNPGSLSQTDTQSVPARRGTVIVDGCLLDSLQLDTLGSAAAKLVIRDVVLDCLLPHADGTVTPADASAQAELDALITQVHSLGYSVTLGANFVTDNGYVVDGNQTAKELADPTWVASVVAGIASVASQADGVELDLEQLPPSARANVTALVGAVAAKVHPGKQLGIYLPPSTTSPSDVSGGDAFDVAALANYTDRFRVMTLDFSGDKAGPTIDSGWAVDAVRFAQQTSGTSGIDVAVPLYGNDFSTSGTSAGAIRYTTFLEAVGLASTYGATPTRSATQELVLDYVDEERISHELWFDDKNSTLVTLGAWDAKTLPTTVGVVYYGFGAEDPALWTAIAQASK